MSRISWDGRRGEGGCGGDGGMGGWGDGVVEYEPQVLNPKPLTVNPNPFCLLPSAFCPPFPLTTKFSSLYRQLWLK